ncbi:Hypothetical Protein FCC1311_053042 [Hondaea fermentalgiana]|uniref:Uncharacterized protein n=1 Tax=Hondaea fermentalgiana TaxID=2315210 RepID=A0A2R5GLC9_9STRA|nr:Hypothetical Protein FCC1311_053042 [Hondaea fermentalgiana]|eukprot:GBG29081.1 Hypothetical Protein FCC1311_053042 [Hondaea fermentalgiana]
MGIMHFRSTLALLQREGALRDVFLPFLVAEYDVLLGTLIGTKYHSKLEASVRRKFSWGSIFNGGTSTM